MALHSFKLSKDSQTIAYDIVLIWNIFFGVIGLDVSQIMKAINSFTSLEKSDHYMNQVSFASDFPSN